MAAAKVEEQRGAKNVALIPSVRTFADSKLGVDLHRGSALLKHYRGSLLQGIRHKAEER
ncbi:hypothetical protein B296_00048212 [Ensete ventricosum]|uniref:Uncharacterized protein n=1 Tax=Ensete ventricosum TaxID=4639 RepID=A0A426XXH0_ENSVE|nr:hypothetical protein B296_00048212 [Ensete ventricosum]